MAVTVRAMIFDCSLVDLVSLSLLIDLTDLRVAARAVLNP
jgi:hypothetical protein